MRYLVGLIICTLFSTTKLKAQLYEVGLNLSYVHSDLTPEEGPATDAVFFRDGRSSSGFSIGMQYSKGQPRNQSKRGWDPKYWWTIETSFGRTGGNFSAAIALPNGNRTLQNLKFTFYRLDFTPKFILGSKKIRFYVGPAISRIIYAGYRIDQESSVTSATSGFSGFPVGYEAGVGLAFKRMQVSVRTLRYLNDYGSSFRGIGLPIKNNDIRIMLAFTLKEKHKGAYWDSIDWDN